jgi:hypothetical protein
MQPRVRILRVLCIIIVFSIRQTFAQNPSQAEPPPITVSTTKTFNWSSGAEGWVGTNDFKLTGAFTKLSGPLDGNAWVTECPRNPDTYTPGAYADSMGYQTRYPGPNVLSSPWFDISRIINDTIAISFQQSLAVEAGWDGGWMDYTTDGSTWRRLGKYNDPQGVNWYATATYKNAEIRTAEALDTTTMKLPQYRLYGPGTTIPTLPSAWWTSNGYPLGDNNPQTEDIGQPEGPMGWVRCELLLTQSEYPDIYASHKVKFRYVAFSDAVNDRAGARGKAQVFQGWAIDNFTIGPKAK